MCAAVCVCVCVCAAVCVRPCVCGRVCAAVCVWGGGGVVVLQMNELTWAVNDCRTVAKAAKEAPVRRLSEVLELSFGEVAGVVAAPVPHGQGGTLHGMILKLCS